MAIKMRRGADADFRPEKMQPGELAVTVDGTRKVYAAFAAGDVKELSSKEDVDKTIASGLQSLETSTNNKLQSLEKKASSAVDKISSENQRVQEELSRYEYYTKTESDLKYTVAPRKEASSANGELKLTDADYGLSYLELQGNSEQYTATGTNLFDVKQLVKNMQELNSKYITIGKDGDGEFMNILNNAWNRLRCLEFTNDPTKSYRIGCKARYSSGNGNVLLFAVMYKDGTYTSSSQIAGQTKYTEMSAIIPAGKEVDYFCFSYASVGSYYDVLLDSFYLYPEDAPSDEKPTGGYGTPSPDYPSEVRSVGDIPKDVNGVEIRNLLNDIGLANSQESEWLRVPDSVSNRTGFRFTLQAEFKTTLSTVGYLITPVDNGLNYRVVLTQALPATKTVEFVNANNAVTIRTVDFSGGEDVYFYIFINGTTEATFEQAMEVFKHFRFMVTKATVIDEYRPYIGENNGLVKIESTIGNLLDTRTLLNDRSNVDVMLSEDGKKVTVNQKSIDKSGYVLFDFKYEPNKVYTVYCKASVKTISGSGGATMVAIRKKNMTGSIINGIYIETLNQEVLFKFNTGEEVGLGFLLYVLSAQNTSLRTLEVVNPMIVEGDRTLQEMKALKYQPYYNKVTWIPLREPLRGITGNDLKLYADKVDKEGHVIQNIYCIEGRDMQYFSTDSSGINTSDNPYKWAYWAPGNVLEAYDGTKSVLCNMLKRGNFNINQTVIANTSAIIFNLPNTLTGLANTETDGTVIFTAIRAWVYTNNPLVYYALNKPIEYQIPAIYIETYDQETNIRCLNKVKPSDMTLDYKIAMSSLIKRLEALEEKTVQEV